MEPHQARARLHRVMYLGGNRYDVVGVTFKRGEEFEYEGELPKHLVKRVLSCPVPEAGAETPEIDATMPDDGVAEPPAGEKKRPRRKPAA